MPRVVSLGSVNVDLVSHPTDAAIRRFSETDWFPEAGETVTVRSVPADVVDRAHDTLVGGKGANQAVAAARADASSTLLGTVGDDEAVFGVLDGLREAGVDVSHVGRSDRQTGKAFVFVEPDGENRIAIVDGANAAVDEAYVDALFGRVRDADCLLLQNEIPVAPVDALLSRLDGVDASDRPTVVLDPAPVAGVEPLLDHAAVDVVTPNEHEFAALGGSLSAFDGTVIRTRGPDEIRVYDTAAGDRPALGGCSFAVGPPRATPTDTTGAGDTFDGYLAAELARGGSLRDAVDVAAVAASMSTERDGAQAAIPSRAAVRSRLAGQSIETV